MIGLLLSLLALILIVWGVITLVKGAILFGIILIVVGIVLGGWYGYDRYGGRRSSL